MHPGKVINAKIRQKQAHPFSNVACRATVIGEKTFGKGVVQYYFPMTDGSGIKLTIAKYLTPGPYDITLSGGLQPDHFCSDFPHADRVTPDNDKCILEGLNIISQELSASSNSVHQ